MNRTGVVSTCLLALILATSACTQSDQARVNNDANRAGDQLKQAGHEADTKLKKAGEEAKHDLKDLSAKMDRAAKDVKRDFQEPARTEKK